MPLFHWIFLLLYQDPVYYRGKLDAYKWFYRLKIVVIHLRPFPIIGLMLRGFWKIGVRGFQAMHLRAHKKLIAD